MLKKLKRRINKILKLAWLLSHLVRPIWLHSRGRWWMFKDSPDLLVRIMAANYDGEDEHYKVIIDQAKEELRTRHFWKRMGYDVRSKLYSQRNLK